VAAVCDHDRCDESWLATQWQFVLELVTLNYSWRTMMGSQRMRTTTSRETSRRIEGLDLLRGLAIALVLLRHAWPSVFGGAGVGVVVFFALSGYLITGVLMNDVTRYGRIRFGRFYWHRALRLIPALCFMLLGFLLVTYTFDPMDDRGNVVRTLWVSLTYTMDIPFFHGSDAVSHLWTLAVEEQFYIVWPFVLLIGTRLGRLPLAVLVAAVAIYVACIGTLAVAGDDTVKVYTLPTSWAVVMVMGAAARLAHARVTRVLPRGRQRAVLSLVAMAVLASISLIPEAKDWPGSYLLLGPIVGACAILLIFHLREWIEIPTTWLAWPLRLGVISYAVYLWNYPVSKWMTAEYGDQWWVAPSTVPVTIGLATLSWVIIERPIAERRSRMKPSSEHARD
jgi:peptidoglycan/LPS O-acetylase OafA/YrhL